LEFQAESGKSNLRCQQAAGADAGADRKEVASILRSIYTASKGEARLMALAQRGEAFQLSQTVLLLNDAFGFLEIRNSRIGKAVKEKSLFPARIALLKASYPPTAETGKRRTMRTRNRREIMTQLSRFFRQRLKDRLRRTRNQGRACGSRDDPAN
jgi:transposase-like protein